MLRLRGVILPSLVIAVVTIIYGWNLVTHLTTAIPGQEQDHDVATMVWNVYWVQHSLNTGGDLLRSDAVLLPFGADLRLHTYGLTQGFMAYPFTRLLGVTAGFNIMWLLSLFLNGAVLYILIAGEIDNPLAALVAAVWTMLSTPLLFQLDVGRPAFASLWIVAGALIFLRRLCDKPDTFHAFMLGFLLILALFSDFQILLFTAVWLLFYGLYRLLRDKKAVLTRQHRLAFGTAGIIVLIPFMFIFYPALTRTDGFVRPSLRDMVVYSFRFWDYVTPSTLTLVYGYELLVTAILALVVFRGRGQYRFWLLGSLVLLILALGPFLQLPPNRQTDIPLPFAILSLWSPVANFRTPYRLTIPALIGFGVAAALVYAWLINQIQLKRQMVAALSILAIGLRLLFALHNNPLRVQMYPDHAFYRQLANEPGDFSLIEVPFGVRSGLHRIGDGGEILQYYQQFHHKPILNGMIARLPFNMFEHYRSHPSLALLSGEAPNTSSTALDDDFADVLAWSNARYVLLHRTLLDEPQRMYIEAFLNQHPLLEILSTDASGLVVYRVAA